MVTSNQQEQRRMAVQAFVKAVSTAVQELLKIDALKGQEGAFRGVQFVELSQDEPGFIRENGQLERDGDDWHLNCVAPASFAVMAPDDATRQKWERTYPDQGEALLTDVPSIMFVAEYGSRKVVVPLTWNEAYQLGYALMKHAEVCLWG